MREREQAVEAEQSEDGTAPDHQSALPPQRAGDLALTPPGDQEGWIIFSLHERDRRARVEIAGRNSGSVCRIRIDGWNVWRYSGGGPRGGIGYACFPQGSGNFLLLGHVSSIWEIGMGRELNHLG